MGRSNAIPQNDWMNRCSASVAEADEEGKPAITLKTSVTKSRKGAPVTEQARREYADVLRARYQRADKQERGEDSRRVLPHHGLSKSEPRDRGPDRQRPRFSVAVARTLDAAALRAEQHVEGGEASVTARDLAVEVELLPGGPGRVRVDLLLQHPKAVADADDLPEKGLDRHLLGLDVWLARDESEGSTGPAGSELKVHVDPAVVAEDVPDGLPDAVGLGVALPLLDLEAVEPEGHAPGVTAAEDDHVLAGLVGDDAANAELEMADDRPYAEAGDGFGRGSTGRCGLRRHRAFSFPVELEAAPAIARKSKPDPRAPRAASPRFPTTPGRRCWLAGLHASRPRRSPWRPAR